jgi:hypothetical protein
MYSQSLAFWKEEQVTVFQPTLFKYSLLVYFKHWRGEGGVGNQQFAHAHNNNPENGQQNVWNLCKQPAVQFLIMHFVMQMNLTVYLKLLRQMQ